MKALVYAGPEQAVLRDVPQPEPKEGAVKIAANAVAFAARTLGFILELTRGLYRAFIQEQSMGIHYHKEREALDYMLNTEDLTFVDGFVELPWCAGLGVEVNESLVLEENKQPHSWKNPVWRHQDGSVAEW